MDFIDTKKIIDNIFYMLEQYKKLNKRKWILPIITIFTTIGLYLFNLFFPVFIINFLNNGYEIKVYLLYCMILLLFYTFLDYLKIYAEESLSIYLTQLWNLHFYKRKQSKITDIPFDLFIKPEIKSVILGAHLALNRNINVNLLAFYRSLTNVITYDILFIILIVIGFRVNWAIIVILFSASLLDLLLVKRLDIKRLENKKEQIKVEKKIRYLFQIFESSSSFKDIILNNYSSKISKKLTDVITEKVFNIDTIQKRELNKNNFITLVIVFRNIAIFGILFFQFINNTLSSETIILIINLYVIFDGIFFNIIENWRNLLFSLEKVSDYRKLMELSREIDKPVEINTDVKESVIDTIEFKNVYFSYDSTKNILENISFSIKKGERIAIVGENGAGKSTIVSLLCKLISPTSGNILINGADLEDIPNSEHFKKISSVFQDIVLLPTTIQKNITSDEEIDFNKLDYALSITDFNKVIKKLPDKLDTTLVSSVNLNSIDLSGGEQQKLLMTRSVYKSGDILILDEPTSSLDAVSENRLYETYLEMTKNSTSIYISHRLASTKFCDKILYLSGGKITEQGTHEELMRLNQSYAKMYKIQSERYSD